MTARARDQRKRIFGDHAFVEGLIDAGSRDLTLREVVSELSAIQVRSWIARHPAHLVVDVRDEAVGIDRYEAVSRRFDQSSEIGLLFPQLLLELALRSDCASSREHALEAVVAIEERACVVADYCLPPLLGASGQLVVSDLALT